MLILIEYYRPRSYGGEEEGWKPPVVYFLNPQDIWILDWVGRKTTLKVSLIQ
jgi:hypothetical protein